ncbi:MAG: ATP-binding cassette domain-containing protein, partial [Lachnospiraceae bacterium]|nr:ATP-binding cassette domain-containing protein [Lachnospiraceae bacterium]
EIKETVRKVGLNPDDKKYYKKYSLGMKQRLGIAAAIMEKPDIILLDEPINAIDEAGVNRIRDILFELRDENRIIIVACHDKEELELLADEIFEMVEGNLQKSVE